jgi:hypothetical protein
MGLRPWDDQELSCCSRAVLDHRHFMRSSSR